MTLRRRYWWLIIVGAVALIDFVGRVTLGFVTARVILFESVLFVGVCVLFAMINARYPPESLSLRRVERWLAVAFGLAGIRVALWAAGTGVAIANIVVLAVGLVLVIGLVIRKRYARKN